MEDANKEYDELQIQLRLVLMKLDQVLDRIDYIYTPITTRWLSEEKTMKVLNLTQRGMEELRQKQILRTSSATGRNFLYYVPHIENYIYDNSGVKRRRKNPNRLYKPKKTGKDGRKRD
jgi:hypothetical protein